MHLGWNSGSIKVSWNFAIAMQKVMADVGYFTLTLGQSEMAYKSPIFPDLALHSGKKHRQSYVSI